MLHVAQIDEYLCNAKLTTSLSDVTSYERCDPTNDYDNFFYAEDNMMFAETAASPQLEASGSQLAAKVKEDSYETNNQVSM